uniref:Low-density lipoprotein receptor domain class A n=1 Tax=Caenorhabditis japonica TaxID=281687 RepID=A0A8R1IJ96_CAEJA
MEIPIRGIVGTYYVIGATCAQGQFQCADGSKCIARTLFQNGNVDCPDGSDEECTTSQFACKCGAVRCVAEKFVMDGNWDCEDGSDEFIENE